MSIAILIGNTKYDNCADLPCCKNDVEAFESLVKCTSRFDEVYKLTNLTGEQMRDELRDRLNIEKKYDEVMFYFSGHGDRIENELFLCGTDFTKEKPNNTGLPLGIMHELVRGVSPVLFTKILDACYAGEGLIKSDYELPLPKGFERVVQFSSSLASQTSLAGENLSGFTEAFLRASIEREEGAVFYTDIVSKLRDNYLRNDEQTPFFVSQGHGRDRLIDDASALGPLRKLLKSFEPQIGEDISSQDVDVDGLPESDGRELTPIEKLKELDESFIDEDSANVFIDSLFSGVVDRFKVSRFSEFFEVSSTETSYYEDPPAHDFMVRVLSKEDRPDEFVTAKSRRKKKQSSNLLNIASGLEDLYNPSWTTQYDLNLNCTLSKAQFKLTFEPTTRSLQKLRLTLSVAPSLKYCYLFEILTKHQRTDWTSFDKEGDEVLRRWYKLEWGEELDYLLNKVTEALEEAVENHIESVVRKIED